MAKRSNEEILFEEVSSINSRLTNVQRDLAQKNARLEKAYEKMKAMQEELMDAERLRVLTETAGGAAHEINQPLSLVIGTSQMAIKQYEDEAVRADFETILVAGRKIQEIVKNMEDVSRYRSKPYVGRASIVDFSPEDQDDVNDEARRGKETP